MAVWLITGGTGFVGRHVLAALQAGVEGRSRSETEVIALGRRRLIGWPEQAFATADLNNAADLRQTVARVQPDYVIHTAGRTPPASDEELYCANFWTTIHLLGALRSLHKPVRIVLSGSAAELGPVDSADLPVDETHPCRPIDAYGRSKWLATASGLAEDAPLEVVVARVFNPIGPGIPSTHAFGQFAARLNDPDPDPLDLAVGDLDARRDFIDVRDVAQAMIALAGHGHSGLVYNVGTGRSRPVGEGLDLLVRLSGRSVRMRVDPGLKSRRGPADSRADIDRIVDHTGWRPSFSWEQSLADLWHEAQDHQGSHRRDEGAAA
jgi:GDP-4-dehydro-6-deoxy-D-mannose reductase